MSFSRTFYSTNTSLGLTSKDTFKDYLNNRSINDREKPNHNYSKQKSSIVKPNNFSNLETPSSYNLSNNFNSTLSYFNLKPKPNRTSSLDTSSKRFQFNNLTQKQNENQDYESKHHHNNERSISKNTLQRRLSIKSPEHYDIHGNPGSRISNITSVNKSLLPPNLTKKKTLVLDLDETLIHADFKRPRKQPTMTVKVNIDGTNADVFVFMRPYVKEFLEKMSHHYEIMIFTASLPNYANAIIDRLPNSKVIVHRLYRHHCFKTEREVYIKEMKKLGRDIKDVIIIDNNPPSYTFDVFNGIPILSWHDDQNDNELLKMIPMLEFLSKVDDVRDYIQKFIYGNFINYLVVSRTILEENKKAENNNTSSYNQTDQNKQTQQATNNLKYQYNNYFNKQPHQAYSQQYSQQITEREKELEPSIKDKTPKQENVRLTNDQQLNNKHTSQFQKYQDRPYTTQHSQDVSQTNNMNVSSPNKSFNLNKKEIDDYTALLNSYNRSKVITPSSDSSNKYQNNTNKNINNISVSENYKKSPMTTTYNDTEYKYNQRPATSYNQSLKQDLSASKYSNYNFSEMSNEINKFIETHDYDSFKVGLNNRLKNYSNNTPTFIKQHSYINKDDNMMKSKYNLNDNSVSKPTIVNNTPSYLYNRSFNLNTSTKVDTNKYYTNFPASTSSSKDNYNERINNARNVSLPHSNTSDYLSYNSLKNSSVNRSYNNLGQSSITKTHFERTPSSNLWSMTNSSKYNYDDLIRGKY